MNDIAAGTIDVLLTLGDNAYFESPLIHNVEPVADRPLLDDPITLLGLNGLHDLIYHLPLSISDVLEHNSRAYGLGDGGLLLVVLFSIKFRNVEVLIGDVGHVPLLDHALLHLLNGLRLLLGYVIPNGAVPLLGQGHVDGVVPLGGHHHLIAGRSGQVAVLQGAGGHAPVLVRHGRLDLVHEDADHGDVVRAQLVLQPELVALGHDGPARLQWVRELGADVDDALIRQELEHPVRRQDDDLVVRSQLPRHHLRLREDSQFLRDAVPQASSEGRARIFAVGTPNARGIAALVDLLPQFQIPPFAVAPWPSAVRFVLVLVQYGLQALDLIEGQDPGARGADPDALVLPVRRLIATQRQGPQGRSPRRRGGGRPDRGRVRVFGSHLGREPGRDPLSEDGAAVPDVADGDAVATAVDVGRYRGGSGQAVVQVRTAVHAAIRLDVRAEGARLRLVLGQFQDAGAVVSRGSPHLLLPRLRLRDVLGDGFGEVIAGVLGAFVAVAAVAVVDSKEGVGFGPGEVMGDGVGVLVRLVSVVRIIPPLAEIRVPDLHPPERRRPRPFDGVDPTFDLRESHRTVVPAISPFTATASSLSALAAAGGG
mmetsp:Transcript_28887/g.59131  ORF Transcript_28887/g.59131 Transcript_28887/m.59131 type:complete len:595 (+) Transcript_28887:792-2576(+)